MSSRIKKEETGYSLIEVVVAILLLSIAIIPMVSMFDAGLRAAVLGSNYDTARTTATEELEEIKALPYEEAVGDYDPNDPDDNPYDCTAPIPSVVSKCEVQTTYVRLDNASGLTDDPTARSMMRVEVTVEWAGGDYTTTGLLSDGSV